MIIMIDAKVVVSLITQNVYNEIFGSKERCFYFCVIIKYMAL